MCDFDIECGFNQECCYGSFCARIGHCDEWIEWVFPLYGIILISIGACIVLSGLIVLACCCVMRRRRMNNMNRMAAAQTRMINQPTTVTKHVVTHNVQAPNMHSQVHHNANVHAAAHAQAVNNANFMNAQHNMNAGFAINNGVNTSNDAMNPNPGGFNVNVGVNMP
ncbi:unnamed protein product [Moneuplotes crassus]|uniref:Uncharacterized protein n=1 Tax=Euplotes crassus TaxID=5936 RepID=A0AAD1XXX2_EUPCR|nr:unnamed protein product [Moneuplotes crassus]